MTDEELQLILKFVELVSKNKPKVVINHSFCYNIQP